MTLLESCACQAIYSRKTRANGICASSENALKEKDHTRRCARVVVFTRALHAHSRKTPTLPSWN
jgi:hypothetical protein